MSKAKEVKIMVIGDGSVGKTSLLKSYAENKFPEEHVPTVFDNYNAHAIIDGHTVTLNLWDTAGSSEFDSLRPLSYPGTDVFLVCFSLVDQETMDHVHEKWVPEIIQHVGTEANMVLVGTKQDLRDSPPPKLVIPTSIPSEKGSELAKKIGAKKYMECSALTQYHLTEVFSDAAKLVLGVESNTSTPKPEKHSSEKSNKPPTPEPIRKGENKKDKKGKKGEKDDCLIQ